METNGNHHVFARVTGHGLTVLPYAPYRMRYGPFGENVLEVEHDAKYARIVAEGGGYTSKISEGTGSLSGVMDIEAGLSVLSWLIETTVFRCVLPVNYWLCSTDGRGSLLDLVGPRDELIFFQSPRLLPAVSDLVALGQTVKGMKQDGEKGWVEVSYSHEGVAYRQRHHVLARTPVNLVLTVQSTEEGFQNAREVAVMMANSLELTGVPPQ